MSQDNPDTIPTEEDTHWEATQVDDVFLPAVRVQLGWADVESAVARGAIVPAQAHALWASWAMPGSPTRVVADELVQALAPAAAPAAQPWVPEVPLARPAPLPAEAPASRRPSVLSLVVACAVGAGLTYLALGL